MLRVEDFCIRAVREDVFGVDLPEAADVAFGGSHEKCCVVDLPGSLRTFKHPVDDVHPRFGGLRAEPFNHWARYGFSVRTIGDLSFADPVETGAGPFRETEDLHLPLRRSVAERERSLDVAVDVALIGDELYGTYACGHHFYAWLVLRERPMYWPIEIPHSSGVCGVVY